MQQLLLATAAFLALHFVSSTPLRPLLVRPLGEGPYRGIYSLAAFATLGWMIWAYRVAPSEPLWAGWRHLPAAVMPFAFVLLACGVWRNPTMIGADKLLRSEHPARGMIRITRHPMMWGFMLWSAAHIAARGDLKSTIFFGGFLALAVLGTISIDFRKRSNPDWAPFAAVTSHIPFVAVIQSRNRIVWREIGWTRPLIGLALFAAFFHLHPWLFGAQPY